MALEKIKPRVVDESGNYTFNNVTATGNLVTSNANLGNLAVANYVTGTLTTNIQPNITSLGTLSNLTVTGNATLAAIKTNSILYANGIPWDIGGVGVTVAGSNSQIQFNDNGSFAASGNLVFDNTSNTLTVTNIVANGTGLTNLTGSNVVGAVPSATVAGTVTTAAQPNITTVGTLSTLVVTGTITSGNANLGNLATANFFSGSGNLLSNIQGANVTGQVAYAAVSNSVSGSNITGAVAYAATANAIAGANVLGQVANSLIAGTVYTDAQPNITSVGTLTSLSVSGNIAAGNVTGGNAVSANYFIGNGSLLTGLNSTSSTILKGTSNVNIPSTNGNVTVSVNGNSNVVVVSSAGANVAGSLGVTGNITAPYFIGNGSQLTGVDLLTVGNADVANRIANGTSNVNIPSTNGNITVGVNGTSNVVTIATSGTNVLGNLVATGNVSGNYFVGNGYYLTGVDQLSVGNADIANSISTTVAAGSTKEIVRANIANTDYFRIQVGGADNNGYVEFATADDGSEPIHFRQYSGVFTNIIRTLTLLDSTGNTTVPGSMSVAGSISSGNITAPYFIGNGSQLTGVDLLTVGNADVANRIANGTSNVNIPSTNGNITFGVNGTSNVVVVSTAGTTVTGNITGNYFIGNGSQLTGITATSVGTLPNLNVSGNAVINGNLTVNGTTTTINSTVISVNDISLVLANNAADATAANGAGIIINGANATMLYSSVANAFTFSHPISANGSLLSNIVGANVSGQVANSLVASTVYAEAQPNITSLGTLTSLTVTGNISAGNANLGNNVTANFFTGSGQHLTSVTAVTAATVTTNAQPNITSTGTLTTLTVGNSTSNTTIDATSIVSNVNVALTGSNISLGEIGNIKITGGTLGYFITTDGEGNLSWGAASAGGGGGGVSATGSNTQIQFNDNGGLGATANLTFNKVTNTLSTGRIVASAGANLGSNVSNVYIGGGGVSQILATDGAGNLTWIAQPTATITVDNFTGDGTTTTFTLSTTPSNINQTIINYNGAFQLRTSAYTLSGPNVTFIEAPANGSLIEVTTTMGSTSGAGAFVTRTYIGNGVQTNYTVTSGVTVSSVLVTENGLVQTPTVDYTISGTTLTFDGAPTNGTVIQIRELAIAIATTVSPAYRAYTGNGVQNTFTVTTGLTANSLIIAENGILQRPTTDYTVSGSTVTFVTAPAEGVDIQIRELSLNGGMSTGGSGGTSKAIVYGYSLLFGG